MLVHEQEVDPARWHERAAELGRAGATMLDFLTAVDEPGRGEIEIVAHLVDVDRRERHLLRTRVPRERPDLASLVDVHPGAAWHEREVHEMFGVRFAGHDCLPLLTDGSVRYPLRRTTALTRRLAATWPGALDPADRPATGPDGADARPARLAARPRSRLAPPGLPPEWTGQGGAP